MRYLKIYLVLIKLNFSRLVTYRANFINSIIGSMGWGVYTFLAVIFLTSRAPMVYGWTRAELLALTASYSVFIGFFHMIFSKNFDRFYELTDFGKLDQLLLKPVDSQFLVSVQIVNITALFRMAMGFILLIYITIYQLHREIHLLNIVGFFIFIAIGLVMLYSFWLILSTLMIKFPRLSNIIDLLYNISSAARFPSEMFKEVASYFIFLIPITYIVSTPTKILLEKPFSSDMLIIIVSTIIVFFISRKVWLFALKSYTGVSS